MKKFFAAVLISLSLVTAAFADRADEIKKYSPDDYCKYVGTLFGAGVLNRNNDVALGFKHYEPNAEGRCPRYVEDKEAITVCNWNSFTEGEKAFVSKYVTMGWTFANNIKAEKNVTLDPQEAAKGYYTVCMVKKADEYEGIRKNNIKRTDTPGFVQTGSAKPLTEQEASELILKTQSENLGRPLAIKARVCEHRKILAEFIIERIRAGVTKVHFWAVNPLPDHWSKEMKDRVIKMVDGAFLWPRGTQDFADQVYRDCMSEKDGTAEKESAS